MMLSGAGKDADIRHGPGAVAHRGAPIDRRAEGTASICGRGDPGLMREEKGHYPGQEGGGEHEAHGQVFMRDPSRKWRQTRKEISDFEFDYIAADDIFDPRSDRESVTLDFPTSLGKFSSNLLHGDPLYCLA